MSNENKDYIKLAVAFLICAVLFGLMCNTGCSLFGGKPTTIAPEPETTVKPEQITKLTKKIDAVNSTIITREEIINIVKTVVNTIIISTQNNQPLPIRFLVIVGCVMVVVLVVVGGYWMGDKGGFGRRK